MEIWDYNGWQWCRKKACGCKWLTLTLALTLTNANYQLPKSYRFLGYRYSKLCDGEALIRRLGYNFVGSSSETEDYLHAENCDLPKNA